jgi:amyloid beta precursor protein binding protein 1
MIGTIRLDFDCLTVMERKEYMVEYNDLRLNAPFPELLEFVNSFKFDELELDRHSHVPYPVILLQAIENYRKANDGKDPSIFKEKTDFKNNYIKALAMDFSKELNYSEAIKNSYMMF